MNAGLFINSINNSLRKIHGLKRVIISLVYVLGMFSVNAQVGIGTASPDSSAALDIKDSTRGLLIPRLTASQRNAVHKPAEGLMVFQTDSSKGFWYFSDGRWISVKNNYKHTLVLTGDITDSEATAKIAEEVGPVTQEIKIINCSNLTTVNLATLTSATKITVTNNQLLQNLNLNSLKSVDEDVTISNCALLNSISLDKLELVMGSLSIISTNVTNMNLGSIKKTAGSIAIQSNPNLLAIDLSNFTTFSNPQYNGSGGMDIYNNSKLTTLSLPKLSNVKNISIAKNPKLSTLDIPVLTSAKSIEVSDDSSLTSVSFASLTTLEDGIIVSNTISMTNVSLPALKTTGHVVITDHSGLLSLIMPNLLTARGITVSGNQKLSSFSAPLLQSTTEAINLSNNNLLSAVSLPSLTQVGTFIFINNDLLLSISLPLLTSVTASSGEEMTVINSDNLISVSLPNLISVNNSSFKFWGNKFSSTQINSLLNKFVSIIPNLTGRTFYFNGQIPAAPPTGQGIIDKNTLINRGNVVYTD